MISRRLLVGSALLFIATAPAALAADCKPAVDFKTVTPGKLTVALHIYPPYTIAAPGGGEISGIDSSSVKEAAAKNCLEVVPMVVAPAAAIQAVVSGKADVAIGSFNRTETRSKVLGLSAPTYLDPMTVISKTGVDTVEGMVGKQVGSVTGYLWNADLQKVLGANLKLYPDGLVLAQDLEAGRIDVGLDGYAGPIEMQKAGRLQGVKAMIIKPDPRVGASKEPPQAGFLYTLGNKGLGEALDSAVATMMKDGSLAKALTDAGYDTALLNVGEPRLVK